MGIKDTCYASLFDEKDLPSLYKLMEKVRTTHDQTLVNNFNNSCQKKWNDHNPILEVGNRDIEFFQVSKADDLVTTVGINHIIDQILGVSTVRFQWIAAGTGVTAPAIGQTTLVAAGWSADMSLAGWREYTGSTLRFAAIFPEKVSVHTVNESGIFTGNVSGTMLNRNMFSNNPIVHVSGSGYVISSVIEFVPVM